MRYDIRRAGRPDIEDTLFRWAEKRGYRVAWFDGAAVREAFERIDRLKAGGAFDPAFFAEFLSWLDQPDIRTRSEVRTVLLVAMPRPAHIVTFEDEGAARGLVLPPTYERYSLTFDAVLADLEDHANGHMKVRLLKAPLKTLAATTGFARYGKNNVTYIDDFGSYVQLVAFATDTPLGNLDAPAEGVPAELDECRRCHACGRACPTGAIAEDRFLLHGERCLTGFSESPGELPEAWEKLRTPVLVGCLVCQEVCPVNKGRLKFERIPGMFSSEETAYIIGERGDGPPAPELSEKVRRLGCTEIEVSPDGPHAVFRRNLRIALRSRRWD